MQITDLTQRLQDRFANAVDSFNAGFTTMTAKKVAMSALNDIYSAIKGEVDTAARDYVANVYSPVDFNTLETEEAHRLWRERWELLEAMTESAPFELHQVRDRHVEAFDRIVPGTGELLRTIVELRAAMKDAEVVRVERVASVEETIVRAIKDEMARRKAQFLEAYDLSEVVEGKLFIKGVSANAHYVTNQHGTTFLRVFYYLRGKLTPLAVIVAGAQKRAMEEGL